MRSSSAGGAGDLVSGDIPVADEESGALVSGEAPAEGAGTGSADAAAPSERSAAGEGVSDILDYLSQDADEKAASEDGSEEKPLPDETIEIAKNK